MRKLILDTLDLKHNLSALKERAAGAAIYAVLSADGGGAGLIELAKLLREDGVSSFALWDVDEIRRLRAAGFLEEEILMLAPAASRGELIELADLNVIFTVASYDGGMALNALAEERATVLEAQIRLDAGSGWGGFLPEDREKVLSLYHYLPNVAFSGVYTQIRGDPKTRAPSEAQLLAFRQMLESIRGAGYETGAVHVSDDACLTLEEVNGVRVGRSLLGRGCRPRRDRLIPIGTGEAPLEEPRWLPQGITIGEADPVTLKAPTRVAGISAGFLNGVGLRLPARREGFWARLLGRTPSPLPFRVNGQKVKVLGGIGPYEILLDVTKVKCSAGDPVTFDLDPLFAKGFQREYR